MSGQNSNRFYKIAKWRSLIGIKINLEMFFLVDEMFKQKGNTIKITMGKIIEPKLLGAKLSVQLLNEMRLRKQKIGADDKDIILNQKAGGGALDEKLFRMLKDLRKSIALKKNIPPFVIFQDPSMEEMTMQYPINFEELHGLLHSFAFLKSTM
ncbi:HRDC domain-containing protein [bacterium]|nr:HRDC domain-containing protein [bacterium]